MWCDTRKIFCLVYQTENCIDFTPEVSAVKLELHTWLFHLADRDITGSDCWVLKLKKISLEPSDTISPKY